MINLTKVIVSPKEIQSIIDVCKSGQLAQGEKVAEFEEKFAEFCGVKYAVAVNSGTAALHSALYACGIGAGDEVITTPFSFIATANAILMQGARPVFADVDPQTFNIDPTEIEKKITKKTRAILPVDLYGLVHNTDEVSRIAKKHGLKVIEDACQAVGAEYKGKKTGNFADITCFSFYATKNLFTGEGGMIVTNDKKYAETVRMFRHHGQSEKARYEYYDLGYNYRMTEIEAVMGIEQLRRIDSLTKKRIENARFLTNGLKNIRGLITPNVQKGYKHVFHQYTLRITEDFGLKRDKLAEYLSKKGIKTSVFYPKSLHLVRHLARLGYQKGDFPVSEKLNSEVLSIPVHPYLTKKDLGYIVETIKSAS